MSQKLSCGIVRDLLPLYADKLTGTESNAAVESHLADCDACSSVYRQMTQQETVPQTDLVEIDYFKKVRRSKKRLVLGLLAAVLVLGVGVFVWLRILSTRPLVHYDATTRTLIVNGQGGYDSLKLPAEADQAVNLDVQDDQFHLSAYLPAFGFDYRIEQSPRDYLPGFLERTDRSLAFLRGYLQQNAPDSYPEENAGKRVELLLRRWGDYNYEIEDDWITVWVGDYFWHRDDIYVLALMDPERIEWQHIGFSSYLAFCVDPYRETSDIEVERAASEPYYEAFLALGGQFDGTPEDELKLNHAIAYVCLTEGMGWGSAYESRPVTEYGLYTGPAKGLAGNAMSPAMSVSFLGWLTEQYGFDRVSTFCFDQATFLEAFGVDYPQAYDAWSTWLQDVCG